MARPLRKVLEDPEVLRDLQQHPASFRFKEGASLVVSAVHRPPHVALLEEEDGSLSIAGPLANLMNTVAHSLNFTYRVVRPPDGTYGTDLGNGSWSGMLGQVIRKEADVSLGPFAISWSRFQAVDFAHHYIYDYASLIKSKGLPEIDPWGFAFPLAPLVWAALLAALVVSWLAVLVLGHGPRGSGWLMWASQLLLQHLRIILRQDIPVNLFHDQEKLMVGGWLLLAMMATVCYIQNLVSLLAVRHIPQPIQTLRDVVEESGLSVIVEPKTIVTDMLYNIESGDLKAVGDLRHVGRIKYEVSSSLFQAVDTLVRRGDHVLVTIKIGLIRFISDLSHKTGRCDFYVVRESLFHVSQCMVGQKGNPFVPAISHRIRALVESGLYEHWLLNNIPFERNCRHSPSKITVREPLAIKNLWGMLVLLGAGHLLALATFCWELYLAKLARAGSSQTPSPPHLFTSSTSRS